MNARAVASARCDEWEKQLELLTGGRAAVAGAWRKKKISTALLLNINNK